jgi:hypothetical protein
MKSLSFMKFLFILFISFSLTSCVTVNQNQKPKRIPPGQAKKMTGSKSARPYAPGQQKKKH